MNQLNTWYRMQPPAIRALLTINVVIYVLWFLLFQHFDFMQNLFRNHLALQAEPATFLFQPWQLVTYSFLHLGTDLSGILHITFNMLWLVWIGRDYEELHGSHRLLAVYIIAGIGGGILSIVLQGLFPGFPSLRAADAAVSVYVHGASASVLGIMMTMAILHPYKSVGLLFLGTIRLLYIVLGFLVIDVLFLRGNAVGAHWGGALFGFLFAKAESSGVDLSSWANYFFRGNSRSGRSSSGSSEGDSVLSKLENWLASRNGPKEPQPKKQPTRERTWRRTEVDVEVIETSKEDEVDRILDKISAEGYEALTPAEKKILYEASRK